MWVTPVDVRDRWLDGPLDFADEQIQRLIEDAEDLALSEFPSLVADVNEGRILESRVVRVVSRMVIRVLRNPSGQRTVSQTTGPFTDNVTYGGDNPGELFLSDDDRRDLGGVRRRRRAFTVMPGGL